MRKDFDTKAGVSAFACHNFFRKPCQWFGQVGQNGMASRNKLTGLPHRDGESCEKLARQKVRYSGFRFRPTGKHQNAYFLTLLKTAVHLAE